MQQLQLLLLVALAVGMEAKPLNTDSAAAAHPRPPSPTSPVPVSAEQGVTGLKSLHKRYVNDYDAPIDFSCPAHQSIYIIHSIHNNDAEDRIWDFRCKETFDLSRPVSSFATSYVNTFDEKLDFTCPFNSIVSGIGSYHNNDAEDRRWKFTCTMQANVCLGACQWTDYLNDFDSPIFWVAPDSRYLVGAHSYHSNDAEDRRWKFQFCTKAAC
ncbi:hemagglutinin/amebocyte aggregation factor-like isoform X2 [Petromyzon marinus]|uniref:Hemagglutinin/amebocyte aggregation factor-like isoform X2 n=1 Tax=Petromyzon marinus TaxID=7757 RepID=A0AAJ7XH55_PETMA|nr:hemagglutinin/amebocyte aggregation factor-like isoform X2 [Petromyzon marinus]